MSQNQNRYRAGNSLPNRLGVFRRVGYRAG
nr:MAG TPA: hypothetical protein [Bacteriophage sp.]